MAGRIKIVTESECETFNKIRREYEGKILGYRQIVELFKINGIKSPEYFMEKMINYRQIPIITKISRGKYKFSDKPVYIKVLQAAWNENPKKVVKPEPKSLEEEIEDAIILLSDNGYKVLKKVFDLERALKADGKSPVMDFIRWEEIL